MLRLAQFRLAQSLAQRSGNGLQLAQASERRFDRRCREKMRNKPVEVGAKKILLGQLLDAQLVAFLHDRPPVVLRCASVICYCFLSAPAYINYFLTLYLHTCIYILVFTYLYLHTCIAYPVVTHSR